MHVTACANAAEELLTSSDVARLARGEITPATVRVDASRGRLRSAAITPRGQRLYRRADVEAYLATRAARPGAVS